MDGRRLDQYLLQSVGSKRTQWPGWSDSLLLVSEIPLKMIIAVIIYSRQLRRSYENKSQTHTHKNKHVSKDNNVLIFSLRCCYETRSWRRSLPPPCRPACTPACVTFPWSVNSAQAQSEQMFAVNLTWAALLVSLNLSLKDSVSFCIQKTWADTADCYVN